MFSKKGILLVLIIWFTIGVGLNSCVYHVKPQRPAPRVEIRPYRPASPRAKWVPGRWKWNRRGRNWIWIPGHWK